MSMNATDCVCIARARFRATVDLPDPDPPAIPITTEFMCADRGRRSRRAPGMSAAAADGADYAETICGDLTEPNSVRVLSAFRAVIRDHFRSLATAYEFRHWRA